MLFIFLKAFFMYQASSLSWIMTSYTCVGRKKTPSSLQICFSTLRKHNHKCIIGLQSSEWMKSTQITTLAASHRRVCWLFLWAQSFCCCDYSCIVNAAQVNMDIQQLIQTGGRTASGTLQNATCRCSKRLVESLCSVCWCFNKICVWGWGGWMVWQNIGH